MRIWAIVTAGAMLGCATVNAQRGGVVEGTDTVQRNATADAVAGLERGRQLVVHGENYRLLPDVSALAGSDAASQRTAMTQIGASSATLLQTKGRFGLYRRGQRQSGAVVSQVGSIRIHPTVINTRTGALGVLQGTVEVKLKNFADAAAVAAAHGLEIDSSFPLLQTVFLRVPSGKDIVDATAALAGDTRVASAAPDILETVQTSE